MYKIYIVTVADHQKESVLAILGLVTVPKDTPEDSSVTKLPF
jgi:hypothetical protein